MAQYNNLERIAQLQENAKKIQAEIEYLQAWDYLHELAATLKAPLAHYLIDHYGCTEKSPFSSGEKTFLNNSTPSFDVKIAISRWKSMTDSKDEISWMLKARKAAKIIEAYEG